MAKFNRATFRDWAGFHGATFHGRADFNRATFRDWAGFHGATFRDWADFNRATFRDWADFTASENTEGEVACFHVVDFASATFQKDAVFDGRRFLGQTDFTGARFLTVAPLF